MTKREICDLFDVPEHLVPDGPTACQAYREALMDQISEAVRQVEDAFLNGNSHVEPIGFMRHPQAELLERLNALPANRWSCPPPRP